MNITTAYDKIVVCIAAGMAPQRVSDLHASEAAKARVADLVARSKAGVLTADEISELEHYLQIEHLMRLAKARAKQYPPGK